MLNLYQVGMIKPTRSGVVGRLWALLDLKVVWADALGFLETLKVDAELCVSLGVTHAQLADSLTRLVGMLLIAARASGGPKE